MSGQDFKDYVVVITGGSTGLGRAIAVEVATRGAKAVIINYASNATDAAETARMVEAQGAEAVLVQGDVAQDADEAVLVAVDVFTDRQIDRKGTAIGAQRGDLAADADDAPLAGGEVAAHVAIVLVAVGAGHQHRHRPAAHLVLAVAEHRFGGAVEAADPALQIDQHDRIDRRRQQRAEAIA